MEPLATPTALGAWLGEDVDADGFYDRAIAVLDHASALVRIEAGQTWQAETPPDGIPQLVVRVAARMWPNPSGMINTSAGPFSGTFTGAELTQSERAEIKVILNPGARRGLGTISTTRGPIDTESIYVDVVGSDKPIPALSREPW